MKAPAGMFQRITYLILSFAMLAQLYFFRFQLLPPIFGFLTIKGQSCTCPEGRVLSGISYLKWQTPDSAKNLKFDYSEIFLKNGISTPVDPMGSSTYYVEGDVIGIDKIAEGDSWNLKFEIKSYQEQFLLFDRAVQVMFLFQLILVPATIYSRRQKRRVLQQAS